MDAHPMHILRFGMHAEQVFFIHGKDYYDWVLFNANTVHYFASGTASLISGQLSDKPFFIDPATHAFGHHPRYILKSDSDEPKASFAGLAAEYGSPAAESIGKRALSPHDFADDMIVERFTQKVIDFQRRGLERSLSPSDAKYLPTDPSELLKPEILVAPYFYMNSPNFREWLPINDALIRAAKDFCNDLPLFGEIVIDRGLLEDSNESEEIINAYGGIEGCDGFLIWIADFSEHEAPPQSLQRYIDFIQGLSSSGKTIINLYGGYFSTILTKLGLGGVCHGPGYGEDRDVVPVGGGVPRAKFYLNPVHQRLLFETVEFMRLARAWKNADEFYNDVCGGVACRRVIGDDLTNFRRFGEVTIRMDRRGSFRSYPTPETRSNMIFHFLEAKAEEFRTVHACGLGELIEQLEQARAKYEPYMPGGNLRYLGTWAKVLRSLER